MTQEDEELLLKDICARLPYGVKCQFEDTIETIKDIWFCEDEGWQVDGEETSTCIHAVKPYLFPLSSMTEEQFNELKSYVDLNYEHNTLELVEWDNNYKTLEFWLEEIPSYHVIKVFDWLNKNHFDYRGLIPMGLAIDATNLNVY